MRMNPRRLRRLLAAYGADPVRWPEAEAPAAADLLRSTTEAQALQREARGLDARLDCHPAPAPDPALLERTLARAAQLEQDQPRAHLPWLGPWPRPVWPQLAALAGAAALGLMVGWSDLLPAPAAAPPDAIALTLLDGLE
jgi:hypothetical protein